MTDNNQNEDQELTDPADAAQEAAPAPASGLSNLVKKTAGTAVAKKPAKKAAPAPAVDGPAGEIAPEKMPPGPLVTVVTRNEFYRDGFRNMIRIAILEAVVIIGLILTVIVHINTAKPSDRYFATTADGRIMQLIPLDQQSLNQAALMSWVAQAAIETMSFGYHDYQRRLQQSSRHFTRRGWESFTTALQKSRVLETVNAGQQVVIAEPRSAPILRQSGIFNGKYRWLIEMPLNVTYKSGSASRTDYLTLSLVVERVPSLESPNGVGIEQWIAVQS